MEWLIFWLTAIYLTFKYTISTYNVDGIKLTIPSFEEKIFRSSKSRTGFVNLWYLLVTNEQIWITCILVFSADRYTSKYEKCNVIIQLWVLTALWVRNTDEYSLRTTHTLNLFIWFFYILVNMTLSQGNSLCGVCILVRGFTITMVMIAYFICQCCYYAYYID